MHILIFRFAENGPPTRIVAWQIITFIAGEVDAGTVCRASIFLLSPSLDVIDKYLNAVAIELTSTPVFPLSSNRVSHCLIVFL